ALHDHLFAADRLDMRGLSIDVENHPTGHRSELGDAHAVRRNELQLDVAGMIQPSRSLAARRRGVIETHLDADGHAVDRKDAAAHSLVLEFRRAIGSRDVAARFRALRYFECLGADHDLVGNIVDAGNQLLGYRMKIAFLEYQADIFDQRAVALFGNRVARVETA